VTARPSCHAPAGCASLTPASLNGHFARQLARRARERGQIAIFAVQRLYRNQIYGRDNE
jgi:hypothetical protein